jgi:hypothetical protein
MHVKRRSGSAAPLNRGDVTSGDEEPVASVAWVKGCNPPSDTIGNPREDRESASAVVGTAVDVMGGE